MIRLTFNHRQFRAFSTLEVLLAVAGLAILVTGIIAYYGKINLTVRNAKMDSDLRTLNSAVSAYVNLGGALTDTETTETVIRKLKSKASSTTSRSLVGISGSFLDARLEPVLQTAAEAQSDMVRIYYDPAKKKFKTATEGPSGIRSFTLNPVASENGDSNVEDRKSVVSYANESTWVWDYGTDARAVAPGGPTQIITNPIPVSVIPAVSSSSTPEIKLKLQPPIFSRPSGEYPIAEFDLLVTINNNNPAGSSQIKYSLNFGEWIDYSGPVSVPPNGVLRSQAIPLQTEWDSSVATQAHYTVLAGSLLPPAITLSSPIFDESTTTIDVIIDNPNGGGTSTLHYALKSPSGSYPPLASYLPYSGPFTVDATTFPEGFSVQAYAKANGTNTGSDSDFAQAHAQASFFEIPLTGNKILFVIDASGSMNNEFLDTGLSRFEVVISEMISALTSLPASKRFGIAMFDAADHWIYNGGNLQQAGTNHKQAAIMEIGQVTTGNGTNYDAGLAFPLHFTTQPDQVIFLSDGRPNSATSWHDELDDLISAAIQVDCIGIECNSSAKANLDFIASQTGGATKYIDKISNNGHGNNTDGVDSSNPGQGNGGPNGEVDPSGGMDDEADNGNSGRKKQIPGQKRG